MKALGLSLILLAVGLAPASAQVTVEVTQDQDQFLPGEALTTAVRITNRSGQSLRLGEDNDWLVFSVQGREHSGQVHVALSAASVSLRASCQPRRCSRSGATCAPQYGQGRRMRLLVPCWISCQMRPRSILTVHSR